MNKFPNKSKNEFPTSSKFNSKEKIFTTSKESEKSNNLKKNTQIYVDNYNTLNNPNQNRSTINNNANNILQKAG